MKPRYLRLATVIGSAAPLLPARKQKNLSRLDDPTASLADDVAGNKRDEERACAVRDGRSRRKKRLVYAPCVLCSRIRAPRETTGLQAHGSAAITASRHHLYLRDTAKPCPGRIVTAQGPYSRRLALIGPPRYLAPSFLSSRMDRTGPRP